jgi:hypothetical protein
MSPLVSGGIGSLHCGPLLRSHLDLLQYRAFHRESASPVLRCLKLREEDIAVFQQ